MRVGIVVYSNTGNTLSVSLKLDEELKKRGIKSRVEKIQVERDMKKDPNKIDFTVTPNIDEYDIVVLASPVEAFSLSPVMKNYLKQLKEQHKPVLCFVTQFFPYPWMGGNNAIKQMKEMCTLKGLNVIGMSVINWKNKKRETMIEATVSSFTKIIEVKK